LVARYLLRPRSCSWIVLGQLRVVLVRRDVPDRRGVAVARRRGPGGRKDMASLATVTIGVSTPLEDIPFPACMIHHLEVIQETHVGVAERDLPLRSCIWDYLMIRTQKPISLHRRLPLKAQSNSRRNNGLNAVSFNFATSSTKAVIAALSTCVHTTGPSCWALKEAEMIRTVRTLGISTSRRLSRRSSPSTKTLNAERTCSRTAGRGAARRLRLSNSK